MTSEALHNSAGAHGPAPDIADPAADAIQARVLHRDAMMLVIDKPYGAPVHKGPRNVHGDTPIDALFPHLRFGLPRNPELAHRLDRDTSGCLILGRHRQALARLAEMFKAGQIDKTYWAIVEGGPEADEGLIDAPLGRKDPTRGWWMKVTPDGQPSQTRWRVLGRDDARTLAWLELTPLTGRTHQLRVHCQHRGWPIVGDPVYGAGPRFGGPGLQLHARAVTIPINPRKPPVSVTAPAPPHMLERLAACGYAAQASAA
jgi:tRNA pseudouridine32 synthase/23S rRNA pseudouridine746 synthase